MLLSLSACGTSGATPVGTYTATFLSQKGSSIGGSFFPLTLAADGHFVLYLGTTGGLFKGSWAEYKNVITMSGPWGNNGAMIDLVAVQRGKDLHGGLSEILHSDGTPEPPWFSGWNATPV
jgi:hypothetical protein